MKYFSLALALAITALGCASPTSVLAQQKPGNLILIGELMPKPAAVQPFEQGLKQLAAWHVSVNDPQSRAVFQQITGEKRGTYLIVLRGMHWADLDRSTPSDEQEQAEFSKAMGDTVASHVVRTYEEIPRLSHPGLPARNRPSKYYEIDTFHVPLGKQNRFAAAVARFREAIEKTKTPGEFVCTVLSEGGEFGTWELVFGHDTAAEFGGPPPDEILKNAFGSKEADSIVQEFSDLTGGFFTEEVVQFRPDLSYFPSESK
jgi:hypothetical protein